MNVIATPDELDYAQAYAAHQHTSFVPEQRARMRQQEFANEINGLYAELLPLATTPELQSVLDAEIARYKDGYLKHIYAVFAAQSRVASVLITGGSNFPTAQNQKRIDTERCRTEEFLAWRDKARAAIEKAILRARTPVQIQDEDWSLLEKRIAYNLGVIAAIDRGDAPFNRSAFINGIAERVERLARNGDVELVRRALAVVQAYNDSHAKAAITTRHRFWKLLDVAHDAQAKRSTADSGVIGTFAGGEIIDNPAEDRIQIVFDGKPDADMRGKLKDAGWRWSPSQGAWQRKRTRNAIESAKHIVGGV